MRVALFKKTRWKIPGREFPIKFKGGSAQSGTKAQASGLRLFFVLCPHVLSQKRLRPPRSTCPRGVAPCRVSFATLSPITRAIFCHTI